MSKDLMDVITGLHQASLNAIDGALVDGQQWKNYGEEFEKVKVGLKREEGDPILDRRIMDGFKINTQGNIMKLSYASEIELKDVYKEGFEDDVREMMSDIISFLKKEYKRIKNSSVDLKLLEEPHITVQHMNRTRTWLEAVALYEITGTEYNTEDNDQKRVNKAFEKWVKDQEK